MEIEWRKLSDEIFESKQPLSLIPLFFFFFFNKNFILLNKKKKRKKKGENYLIVTWSGLL